ncbi:MAG: two-component system sensor histidine kinase NtrB [Acidobacteriota bacterium]
MRNRPIFMVILASIVALIGLVLAGRRVLQRDRAALYEQYSSERTQKLAQIAHSMSMDQANVVEDLDLAATLVEKAESPQVAERELHAIATIKREYLVMDSRGDGGDTTEVIAFDAPPRSAELARAEMTRTLDAADAAPDTVKISRVLTGGTDSAWYRVYARRARKHRVSIGIVVDMRLLLARAKLPVDAMSRVLVLGPDGTPTPASDRMLSALAQAMPHAMGADSPRDIATTMVSVPVARAAGLPAAPAVATAAQVKVDDGQAWRIIVLSSTEPLDEQEGVLVRRVLTGSGLVLVLLILAAGYVIHATRRTTMLRERLRNAARLEHLTERAEKIVDHIPSGVLMLSEDRRITGVNRWFTERFTQRVTGEPLSEVVSRGNPEDAAILNQLVDRAIETRQPQSMHRARLALFAEEVWLNIHAIPLERGIADVSTLVVFEDLTQMRRIEERLLHSEKLVTAGQLAAGIAHEIGTPLNVARGRVELALSHLGGAHAESSNLQVAIDQTDRVTRLIQQLLDYVRAAPETMQPVDANATLQTVCDLLATQASKRDLRIEVRRDDDIPAIRANPDQVQQVLINLVLNALDACERGGRVELSAVRRDGAVVLQVSDDGHGIARELQAQVFDPFFTTKKRGQGTGLGLWVVAQIVRAHSGEIELESTPGSGTRVRIAWPVAA